MSEWSWRLKVFMLRFPNGIFFLSTNLQSFYSQLLITKAIISMFKASNEHQRHLFHHLQQVSECWMMEIRISAFSAIRLNRQCFANFKPLFSTKMFHWVFKDDWGFCRRIRAKSYIFVQSTGKIWKHIRQNLFLFPFYKYVFHLCLPRTN